jgi:hypothetical protein
MLAHSRDIEIQNHWIHLDVSPVDNETYLCSGSGPGCTVGWPRPDTHQEVFIRAVSPDAALSEFETAISNGVLAIMPTPRDDRH